MKKILTNIAKVAVFVPAFALLAGVALPATPTFADCSDVNSGLQGGLDCGAPEDDGRPTDLFANGGVFQQVVNVLLFLIGAISVIMLIYGGIRYTISQGDSGAVTNAKNTIMYAIIGIIVAILAYAIVNFVISSFTGQS